ncbi:TonB-dependent receptor [Opacimonas viscosa]|uniref:TonB-dependent receptor n=1 Tax=Opacimonas viscosa TaxID=2961944 RepID=A0AA42BLG5_9ALTE|nr:TonB-dependent receptor [Opacimonas viscosa]MCP3427567.1 TonB-dependent receptor [Opacimonas viscosa]
MNTKFKLAGLSLAVLQVLNSPLALADDTAKVEAEKDIEVIEIKGFGSTLNQALRNKRHSESTVEFVSADDLGILPDVTITDAIARLPGVAADRDRGNASRLSIRGLGPRLNAATLNNRELVSAEPSRDVRYEQFPSELISSVEVYKTPMANQVEGGIAGLVNMNFVKPLSKDTSIFNVGASVMHYELADDLPNADAQGSRANISYVTQINDSFGIALGLSTQEQPSIQRGIESWNYNNTPANQGDVDGNGVTEAKPWGGQIDSKMGNNERLGGLVILEWEPNDEINILFDTFYSKFDIQEQEDQMYFDSWGDWQGGQNWAYNNSQTSPIIISSEFGGEQLVEGALPWASHSIHNAMWFQENELLSTGVKLEWQRNDWLVKADLGYSEASIESVWVDITSNYNGDAYELGWSTHDADQLSVWLQENPDNGLTNTNISDPALYSFSAMAADQDRELTDEMLNFSLDVERMVDWGHIELVSFGGRISQREKANDEVSWSRDVVNDLAYADNAIAYDLGDKIVAPSLVGLNDWHSVANNVFGGLADRSTGTRNDVASWQIEEDNTALYAMVRLTGELFGLEYSGNAGIRYVSTEVTSSGTQRVSEGWQTDNDIDWYEVVSLNPVTIEHDYSELLPSVNLLFTLSEDSQVRIGAARTMSRPPLIEMRTGFDIDSTVVPPAASGGNPTLDPFIANQVDISYEYYFGDDAAIAINTYYKDLETHIGRTQDTIVVGDVEMPLTGPANGDGGTIKGAEVLYQQSLTFLPYPFDGLGVYANYSYADSDVKEFYPENNPFALGGLSEHVGNFTLWYYKSGFDARVSYNYRSEYTTVSSWEPEKIALAEAEATVDVSFGYELTENLKLTLQAQNLTNEPAVSYYDNDTTRPAQYNEWGRRFLIGFNYSL